MMEWRIRKSGYGGYVAELGTTSKSGIVPAFNVYESARFDARKKAEAYVKRRNRKGYLK